jgi:hypothetical protein
MALPIITVIKHELTLPSSGEKITFRPFLVKEEKILMMALQGGEAKDMVRGLKEIIVNCVDKDLKVDTLPPFDLEYIFLQLRARSVGDVIPINYSIPEEICKDGKKECTFEKELNLDNIKVQKNKNHKDLIDLTDTIKLKMRYPNMEAAATMTGVEGIEMVNKTFELIGQCIEYIMDGEEMHNLSDYTKKEVDDFLNSLSTQNFKEIQTFFDTMPKLKHEITAKCKVCGKENERVLEGMGDFFS